ncbi:MAG: OsmC family protein [Pseudomonadota bacterium]
MLVKKVAEAAKPASFTFSEFKKPKSGERLNIDISVVVEPLKGLQQKKASVSVNVPGWSDWEIECDEGLPGGGDDAAPSPLMYFSAGVAFCLMSHIQMSAHQLNLSLKSLRLEQRSRFSSDINFDKTQQTSIKGAGDLFETFIHIESDEPAEKIAQFVAQCQQACMAGQSIANVVPHDTSVILNGETL